MLTTNPAFGQEGQFTPESAEFRGVDQPTGVFTPRRSEAQEYFNYYRFNINDPEVDFAALAGRLTSDNENKKAKGSIYPDGTCIFTSDRRVHHDHLDNQVRNRMNGAIPIQIWTEEGKSGRLEVNVSVNMGDEDTFRQTVDFVVNNWPAPDSQKPYDQVDLVVFSEYKSRAKNKVAVHTNINDARKDPSILEHIR